MNRSAMIGLVGAFVLFKWGLFGEVKPSFFMDLHALVVVLVGTLTASFFAAPPGRFISLLAGGVKMIFQGKQHDPEFIRSIVKNVVEAAKQSRTERAGLTRVKCVHPFIKEGLNLVADGILGEFEIVEVMHKRKEFYQRKYLTDAKTLQMMAKFPPAFGLLGAVTGMIGMMSHLQGESDRIGQSMAVALVATFWGICTANVVLLPLSDYYRTLAEADAFIRQVIIDGVLMVKRRDALPLIEEKMNSYLDPSMRLRSAGGKSDTTSSMRAS